MPGSPDGSRPAIFYVNTFHPDERYIVAKQYFLLLLANGLNILEIPFVYFDISQKIFFGIFTTAQQIILYSQIKYNNNNKTDSTYAVWKPMISYVIC